MEFKVAPPQMTILSDHPSRAETQSPDLLALEGRLAAVFDILRHRNTECPVTVAIYGDWGTGKTSAMRWLETQLNTWNKLPEKERKGHPIVHPVWFDPWRYQAREDVWRGIIAEVVLSLFKVRAIKRENFLPQLRTAAKRFGAFLGRGFLHALANIDVEIGAEAAGVKTKVSGEVFRDIYDEWDRTTNPEKAFLNQFEDTLKTWLDDCLTHEDRNGRPHYTERLVLFIDDLDRSLPAVTLEVLEAIKLYLNLQPLMFVVGLDRTVVNAVVRKHYTDHGLGDDKARQYLNKLFQVEIQIPASQQHITSYQLAQLAALDRVTENYWTDQLGDTTTRDTLQGCILHLSRDNPREIKRLVNSALVRGYSASSNPELSSGGVPVPERFAQGLAFYLLQRVLDEAGFPDTLLLREASLEWFQKASEWRLAQGDSFDPIPFTVRDPREPEPGRESASVPIAAQPLFDQRPPELCVPAFDQCIAHEWFWPLLTIPFDSAVGRQAPKLETRLAPNRAKSSLDIIKLSADVRAELAKKFGKSEDSLAASDLDGITELYLSGVELTDADVRQLSRISTLEVLELNNTPVTAAGLKELSRLPALKDLWLRSTPTTDSGLKELSQLSTLRQLHLGGTQVTDAGLKELSNLPALRFLYLNGTKITDLGLKELANLIALQSLSLGDTQVTDAGLKELSNLAALRTLHLYHTKITDLGLKELANLITLQSLNLDGTRITDSGLKELSNLIALQALDLDGTQITDLGLKEVSNLITLRSLHLDRTQITDDGLRVLSNLIALQSLELNNTRITDAGLELLSSLSALKRLNLVGTQVTTIGVQKLKKWIPGLSVTTRAN